MRDYKVTEVFKILKSKSLLQWEITKFMCRKDNNSIHANMEWRLRGQ